MTQRKAPLVPGGGALDEWLVAAAEQKHALPSPPASANLHTQLLLWEQGVWTMDTATETPISTLFTQVSPCSQ